MANSEVLVTYRAEIEGFKANIRQMAAAMKQGTNEQKTAIASLQSSINILGQNLSKAQNPAQVKSLNEALAVQSKRLIQLQEEARKVGQVSEDSFKKTTAAAKESSSALSGISNQFQGFASQFIGIYALQRVVSGTITTFIEFSSVMSKLKAVSGATEAQMKSLSESTLKLAETSIFTATQIGEMQVEFSKLGYSVKDIKNVTEATINLATATGVDLKAAAEVAGATLNGFGFKTKETARLTNVMAKSFNATALDIEDFREAMKLVAPIAKAANISFEATVALMGKLADAGLKGSIAGTALKNLISKLSDGTSDLSKTLGYSVKNTNDLFRALEDLKNKNIDLTEATELTDERSKAAFLTLIAGKDAVQQLTAEFNKLNDEAAKTAKTMQDNLGGDLNKLWAVIKGIAVSIGDASSGLTRFVVTDIKNSLLVFRELYNDYRALANLSPENLTSNKLREEGALQRVTNALKSQTDALDDNKSGVGEYGILLKKLMIEQEAVDRSTRVGQKTFTLYSETIAELVVEINKMIKANKAAALGVSDKTLMEQILAQKAAEGDLISALEKKKTVIETLRKQAAVKSKEDIQALKELAEIDALLNPKAGAKKQIEKGDDTNYKRILEQVKIVNEGLKDNLIQREDYALKQKAISAGIYDYEKQRIADDEQLYGLSLETKKILLTEYEAAITAIRNKSETTDLRLELLAASKTETEIGQATLELRLKQIDREYEQFKGNEEKIKALLIERYDTIQKLGDANLKVVQENHKKEILQTEINSRNRNLTENQTKNLTITEELSSVKQKIDVAPESEKAALLKKQQDLQDEFIKNSFALDEDANKVKELEYLKAGKSETEIKKLMLDDEIEMKKKHIAILLTLGRNATDKEIEEEKLKREKLQAEHQKRVEIGIAVINALEQAQQAQFDRRQDQFDAELNQQDANIQNQQDRNNRGLSNTLAFEERKKAELLAAQEKEKEKQANIKKFEVFVNTFADASKTKPAFEAFAEATKAVALMEIGSAVFAEKGLGPGEKGESTNYSITSEGFKSARTHRAGDRMAVIGMDEGILTGGEIENLGGKKGFSILQQMLRNPIDDRMPELNNKAFINYQSVNINQSHEKLVNEISLLNKNLGNFGTTMLTADKDGNLIQTILKIGLKQEITHKPRKI